MNRSLSPPPTYNESSRSPDDAKIGVTGCGPWLVQRTSIHVESTSIEEGSILRVSTSPSISSDHSSSKYAKFKKRTAHCDHGSVHQGFAQSLNNQPFGSSVTIEAARPLRSQAERRIELKGLEQAASARSWTGSGWPAEAWGKLTRDPEVWDEQGDTLIYFGYHRQDASFRVKSTLLQDTKSEYLCSKLREGAVSLVPDSQPLCSIASPLTTPQRAANSIINQQRGADQAPATSVIAVRYRLYLPPPPQASRLDILRYHITTRNLLALLQNKSLVGLTYYQALVDLQERLEDILPQSNSAQTIIKYLSENTLYNVCNDPSAAAGLLAWSEDNYWAEGWREGFVHCNGSYLQLRMLPEFRDVSHSSRLLLENSSLLLQNQIQGTEDRLSRFSFDDMWHLGIEEKVSVPHNFYTFRSFLFRHYEKVFKSWPPRKMQGQANWLDRHLVLHLQQDFGALYNYLVDHSATWNETQDCVVRQVGKRGEYVAAADGLRLEKYLLAFDRKHSFSHIPKPFPLLPTLTDSRGKHQQSRSLFGNRKNATEKRNIAASVAASNASLLGKVTTNSPLVTAFLKFEKDDKTKDEDPFTVRKARWLLLYGVLQFLDSLAFVSPQVRFSRNADYFLNATTRGLIPWEENDGAEHDCASNDVHSWLESPLS